MPKVTVALLLLALSPLSYADCEHPTEDVVKALSDFPGSKIADWRTFVDCKVWPADSTKTIVALVNPQNVPASDVDESGLYDLEVLILGTGSGNILQSLFQKDALISDAIRLLNIRLDTARYVLAPGVIAFGVRAYRYGEFDQSIHDISLYATQDNKLKEILHNLKISESYRGEAPSMREHDCSSTDINRTIAIGTTSSHGYADLIVQEKKSVVSNGSKDDCTDTKKSAASRRYVLHFDGTSYVMPDELQDG